ncbi:MAG: hypothetical protein JSS29_04720 [Proteobacteria bacterium]|nr:hypothetical protein [Pseudomonadota bacterium]
MRTLTGSLITLAAPLAFAAPPTEAALGGRPPGPPPEAIAACSGKTEGTKVTVTLPDGRTLAATCHLQNGVMAARPAPPAEAVAACVGKVEGDPVSFAAPGGRRVTATCRVIDGVLAAAPAGGPPGGGPAAP